MEHDEIREMLKKQFNDRKPNKPREKNLLALLEEKMVIYRNFGDAEAHLDEMYRILNKKRKSQHEGPANG